MSIYSATDSSYAFYPPEPGKPNPNEPCGPSPRSRVAQAAQKGKTCSYYALQILRNENRIGKCPSESQMRKRQIEMTISKHRKAITTIDETWKYPIAFAKELTEALSNRCTRSDAQEFLSGPAQTIAPEYRQMCCATLQSFCEQEKYDDFFTYTNETYLKAKMVAHEELFRELWIPKKTIESSIPKILDKTWDELGMTEKEWHEGNIAFLSSYAAYGCKLSPWHPEQPIETLIEQLHLHGPHLINGKFGQVYYEDAPFELAQKIEERSIFGWKPSAKRRMKILPPFMRL